MSIIVILLYVKSTKWKLYLMAISKISLNPELIQKEKKYSKTENLF